MEACNFTQVIYRYCILNAFKTVDLIRTRRGVFVNLDCNLQNIEAKPTTAIDVGGSANKQHVDTHSFNIVRLELSKQF